MNKWTAERGSVDKNSGKTPGDAVLLGEGSLSFQVLLFDEYGENTVKENSQANQAVSYKRKQEP